VLFVTQYVMFEIQLAAYTTYTTVDCPTSSSVWALIAVYSVTVVGRWVAPAWVGRTSR